MELMQASHQWATRPYDQRFTSLLALNEFAQDVKARSKSRRLSTHKFSATPVTAPDGRLDVKGLQIVDQDGVPADVTNWSFGQLAQRAGAPAAYMRDLPSPIAADCINYGLRFTRDN